ncbi:MAG: zinc-finger domain-containing protein [Proteobacteria bacterium]|nr:MAG: zinc-finger domain-containing protein [Pseudomonadota bacterium]
MESREIVQVDDDTETVDCNGGGGTLGHPMVYLTFDNGDVVDCYYCSRRFARARALKPKRTNQSV